MLNEFDIACSKKHIGISPQMQSSHIQRVLIAPMHIRSRIGKFIAVNQLHVRLLSHGVRLMRPWALNDVCDDVCSHPTGSMFLSSITCCIISEKIYIQVNLCSYCVGVCNWSDSIQAELAYSVETGRDTVDVTFRTKGQANVIGAIILQVEACRLKHTGDFTPGFTSLLTPSWSTIEVYEVSAERSLYRATFKKNRFQADFLDLCRNDLVHLLELPQAPWGRIKLSHGLRSLALGVFTIRMRRCEKRFFQLTLIGDRKGSRPLILCTLS